MGNAAKRKQLADLRLTVESRSYVDAMQSIMKHQGWTDHPKYMLSGMTALGFRFTVHRQLRGDSPTAYNWMADHFLAGDFIGVTSSQGAGFNFDPTFPLYQRHAIERIKQSIDLGTGAVFWKDGFVIAIGYDDEAEVLLYSDGQRDEPNTLPYREFGCNASPYWYYQVLESKVALVETDIYKESYMQAVHKWRSHDPLLPEAEYACGKLAYDAVIQALQKGVFDQAGAWEIVVCHAAARRDVALYAETVRLHWPESSDVASAYGALARVCQRMVQIADESGKSNRLIGAELTVDLVVLFREAKELEEQAIQVIERLMRETIDNRFHDIALR